MALARRLRGLVLGAAVPIATAASCNALFGVGELRFVDGSGGQGGAPGGGGQGVSEGGQGGAGGTASGCDFDMDDDGVDDCADICAGFDDNVDVDGDAQPDGCDPCVYDGPLANVPLPVMADGITIDTVSLNGDDNIAVVAPDAVVAVNLDYAITDCECPGCIDQIEIGLVPGEGFEFCAYNQIPGCNGDMGTAANALVAPSEPGVYELRFNKAQQFDCNVGPWNDREPAPDRRIGVICVVPD